MRAFPVIFGARRRLVRLRPAALGGGVTFARANVGSFATARGADGATWDEVGADVPRFSGTARGLLIERQGTNGLRIPRFEGGVPGVIGAGGAWPTFMTDNMTASLVKEIIGFGIEDGLPTIDLPHLGLWRRGRRRDLLRHRERRGDAGADVDMELVRAAVVCAAGRGCGGPAPL
jgi:hypothetical protein